VPWQVTGIVMMCIGGVLLCPVAPMCCGWMCQKRASHAAYMQNDSIFTAKRYNRCAGAHAYLHAHTPSLLPALSPPAATDGRAHARRTTTESPNPSVGSGATDDDYRIDIQSHSRNSSQSPRRRRPNDKDAAPLGVGHANADYYGVQPGGQGGQTKSDLEVCFVCRLPCQLSLPSICHAHGEPNWSEPSMLLPAWPRSE